MNHTVISPERAKEIKELYAHLDKLQDVLQSDGEQGVKWLSELYAKEFVTRHPALINWIVKLNGLLAEHENESMHRIANESLK